MDTSKKIALGVLLLILIYMAIKDKLPFFGSQPKVPNSPIIPQTSTSNTTLIGANTTPTTANSTTSISNDLILANVAKKTIELVDDLSFLVLSPATKTSLINQLTNNLNIVRQKVSAQKVAYTYRYNTGRDLQEDLKKYLTTAQRKKINLYTYFV